MSLDADGEERRRRSMPQELSPTSLRRTTLLLAAGGAISVANIYYCQPLLGDMGRSLGVGDAPMGLAAAMTQAGTALGMLVFVPLGDVFERRRLASWMCVASASAVAISWAAWLTAASTRFGPSQPRISGTACASLMCRSSTTASGCGSGWVVMVRYF